MRPSTRLKTWMPLLPNTWYGGSANRLLHRRLGNHGGVVGHYERMPVASRGQIARRSCGTGIGIQGPSMPVNPRHEGFCVGAGD
jgi:hypothetical protein